MPPQSILMDCKPTSYEKYRRLFIRTVSIDTFDEQFTSLLNNKYHKSNMVSLLKSINKYAEKYIMFSTTEFYQNLLESKQYSPDILFQKDVLYIYITTQFFWNCISRCNLHYLKKFVRYYKNKVPKYVNHFLFTLKYIGKQPTKQYKCIVKNMPDLNQIYYKTTVLQSFENQKNYEMVKYTIHQYRKRKLPFKHLIGDYIFFKFKLFIYTTIFH